MHISEIAASDGTCRLPVRKTGTFKNPQVRNKILCIKPSNKTLNGSEVSATIFAQRTSIYEVGGIGKLQLQLLTEDK